jgi:hypothetical protein
VRRASLGPVDVIYGAIDGKLVVSDSAAAVRDLGDRGGDKLSDDKTFRDAADAAAMPDRTTGWLYLNLKDGVPLVDALAELAGSRIPAEYDDNLRPLRSFVFYGTRAGESQMLELFLQAS